MVHGVQVCTHSCVFDESVPTSRQWNQGTKVKKSIALDKQPIRCQVLLPCPWLSTSEIPQTLLWGLTEIWRLHCTVGKKQTEWGKCQLSLISYGPPRASYLTSPWSSFPIFDKIIYIIGLLWELSEVIYAIQNRHLMCVCCGSCYYHSYYFYHCHHLPH